MRKELKLSGKQILSCSFFLFFCKQQEKQAKVWPLIEKALSRCAFTTTCSPATSNKTWTGIKKEGFFLCLSVDECLSHWVTAVASFSSTETEHFFFFNFIFDNAFAPSSDADARMKNRWPTYAGDGESPVCTRLLRLSRFVCKNYNICTQTPKDSLPHPPNPPPPPPTNWRFPLALSPNFRCPE